MAKEWVDVLGFPGFIVSLYGEVYNEETGKFVKPSLVTGGSLSVMLRRDGCQHRRSLSTIVANAFHTPEREDFNSVIHLDGDKENCEAANLRWRPRHFTVSYHREMIEDPFNRWRSQFVLIETDEIFDSIRYPAMRYGLIQSHIYLALCNQTEVWPGPYTFKYLAM